jgi:glycine dehydrogenase subunit 1
MALVGKEGFAEAANLSMQKAHYMRDELIKTGKFEAVFDSPYFREFLVKYKSDMKKLTAKLKAAGFLPGIEVTAAGQKDLLLIAVTEKRTKAEIDKYVEIAGGAI